MNRGAWFWACVVAGLLALAAGLLVPIHLKAVDAGVLRRAGLGTPGLAEAGLGLLTGQGLGAAELLSQASAEEQVQSANRLAPAIASLGTQHPDWEAWGGADAYLGKVFNVGSSANSGSERVTEIIIQRANRVAGLKLLQASTCPAVRELLRCQELTNTVIFPPSSSASGQAMDASIVICGLLLAEYHLTPALSNEVSILAASANRGGSSGPLEQVLLDFLALGQRFNWSQLTVFTAKIEDASTLHWLANDVRKADNKLPVLFSAVFMSGNPAGVVQYLTKFSQTGMKDLGISLRFNSGGVAELLRRDQRLNEASLQRDYASGGPVGSYYKCALGYSLSSPRLALAVKWIFYLAGGWFAAAAMHFARPAVSLLEEPLQVRGVHLAREFLFALGFLLMVLVLSEPFLAQNDQKAPPLLRLQLPTPGKAVAAGIASIKPTIMNQSNLSLITVLVFFVLQGLLYLSSVIKLAEIRRQKAPPAMQLKLLENEEHLFDAGLYLGFAGTIVSLIFASLKVITFSLMAAYSCTAFGIIFVFVFKVFNLRPTRRRLLLAADALTREPARAMGIHASVPQS